MEVFGTALVVGHELILGRKYEGNRLDLIKDIPQRQLLCELAGLNHRLKPAIQKSFKTNFDDQVREIGYFCGGDQKLALPYFIPFKKIQTELEQQRGESKPIIFNRSTNLFAISEILENNSLDDKGFKWNPTAWEKLLKYYLCVNDVVSHYQQQDEDKTHKPFEKLAAGSGFLNELTVVNDPILTLSRFVDLFEYLSKDVELSGPLNDYFKAIGVEPREYIKNLFSICFFHKGDREDLKFVHKLDNTNSDHKIAFLIFDYLSRRGLVKKTHELDLVELKKSPMYKDLNGFYYILDNSYIIEKAYELFINDFWFEAVKSKGIDIRKYKSKIGYFFENYACQWLALGLNHLKHPTISCLNDLRVTHKGNQIELADFYARQNKKVLVGQIKSTGIYSDQQYGTAQSLFRNSEEYFYDVFGLTQLVTSLKSLRDHPELFDTKFPVTKKVQVYPMIVVNEKIFQTPFFPAMFQLKFAEEINKERFDDFEIKPLSLIHISDLERMSYHLSKRNIEIWDLVKANYQGSLFPKPFNITLNRKKLNPDYEAAKNKVVKFTGIK